MTKADMTVADAVGASVSDEVTTLNPRAVERFAVEYVKDYNAAAAWTRAFPHRASMAKIAGPRLVEKHTFARSRIAILSEGRITPIDVNRDRITMELARIAFADVTQLYGEDGRLLRVDEVPADVAPAIKEVSSDMIGNQTIKLHDKLKALDTLADLIGMKAPKKVELSVTSAYDALGDEEINAIILEGETDG
jgi:phage terminase small subunit